MIRFIKELFSPKLKCERLGHNVKSRHCKKVLVESREFREVAAEFEAEIKKCKRCGETMEVIKGKKITSLQGLSMPNSDWDILRDQGYLIQNN